MSTNPKVWQYSMEIACPDCGEKMILYIGLAADTKNNLIECLGCHNEFVPLVPGEIVDGPFPVAN